MVRGIDRTLVEIRQCIDNQDNFVLQGGAGSGKTETLKQTVEYILDKYPEKKLLCITHTNLAVEEINSRIGGDFTVSTIHAFLNELIKDFKRNIKEEMVELFSLEKMSFPKEVHSRYKENEYKKKRHEKYKKLYEKCGALAFRLLDETLEKVPGKRKFDKKYQFDTEDKIISNSLEVKLNQKIQEVNEVIKDVIDNKSSNRVHYTNNNFNDMEQLGYGHDGLLEIAAKLIEKHAILKKILQDRFDYILIDEYQDTHPGIINVFLKIFSSDNNSVGLFGDSMQTIYEEGIGSVQTFIHEDELKEIIKEDNFRSSYPVVDFINTIRTDGLKQKVAFKKISPCEYEDESHRQGQVTFYYTLCDQDDKPVNDLINYALRDKEHYEVLMLTNRLIANELKFENLYRIFSDRGPDPIDRMQGDLSTLLLKDLYEIIDNYKKANYNFVIEKLNYNGWILRKIQDKIDISNALEELISEDRSVLETLEFAFSKKILRKTEQYNDYIYRMESFLEDLEHDHYFKQFEELYEAGSNTFNRINDISPSTYSVHSFKEYESDLKRKKFYNLLFSQEIEFKEVMNYFDYVCNDGKRKTMHMTKGSGLQNVAILLDNFGWYKYNFTKMFNRETNPNVRKNSLNLFYVACSRAIENLVIMMFVKNEEEINIFKEKFKNDQENIEFIEIELSDFAKQVPV